MTIREAFSLLQSELGEKEWKKLFQISNLRGFLVVVEVWAAIFITLGIFSQWPGIFTFLFAVIVVGSRQLALGLVAHEAMHGLLFRSRKVNDFVGKWICAAPVWVDFQLYWEEHLNHHRHLGSEKDPDFGIRKKFPLRRSKWAMYLLTTALGASAWQTLRRRLRVDFGYLTYSLTTNSKPIPRDRFTFRERVRLGLKNIFPTVLTLACLAGVLVALGMAYGMLIYVLAYFTTLRVFFMVHQVSQHAVAPANAPLVGNVRTILLNPITNWFLFPLNSNLHVEHHAMMTVPFYRLRRLHREFRKHNLIGPEQLQSGMSETTAVYCP